MNLIHPTDCTLAHRRRSDGVAFQIRNQLTHVEAVVEAVAECAEVLVSVLAELEGLLGAADDGFEVGQDGVDPSELRQITWFAPAHDDEGMGAARIDAGQAVQVVAAHIAAWNEIQARLVGDGLGCEAGDRAEFDAHRMTGVVGGNGRDDWNFVGRVSPADTGALTAEVGVIELNQTRQRRLAVALSHGPHYLLTDQPGCAVRRAQMAHQRQRRQTSLGLADQVGCKEPGPQRKFGAAHQRVGRQRRLVATGGTLKQHSSAVSDCVVIRARATRAAKAVWPALSRQQSSLLGLRSVAVKELNHGNTRLKLDSFQGHRWRPCCDKGQLRQRQGHQVSPDEVHDESGAAVLCLEFDAESHARMRCSPIG